MLSYNSMNIYKLLEKTSRKLRQVGGVLALAALLFFAQATPISARENSVFGIHLLHPTELGKATELLKPIESDEWHYVTVPLTLDDLKKEPEWQDFFRTAKDKKVIPIVRLMTKFENGAWAVPTKKNVVDQFTFLGKLDWPYDQKYIIVFNEVNHAKEWGGTIDPHEYTDVLRFSADWAHSEAMNYKVLPAAMDLAAPTGGVTREAFQYLNEMLAYDPEILTKVDYWNSHSYPNPGFSSSPERTDKRSMRGFIHELAFVKEKTGRDLQTFITETGWEDNGSTRRYLSSYYQYTADHIWSDERVIAVTPFILQGDPGPFSGFSFVDKEGQPTSQYRAYQAVIRQAAEKGLAEKR
jgi:hypothetical protein